MNSQPKSLASRFPQAGGAWQRIGAVLLSAVLGAATTGSAAQPLPAASAEFQAGAQLARQGRPPAVLACVTCHGVKGEGIGAFPPLAGTGRTYLREQLDAFADGSRQNAVMAPIAKALTDAERAAAAAYFSSLPNPLPATTVAAPAKAQGQSDKGTWLVERGRWSDHLPACVQCHGAAGEGVGENLPPIALLDAQYMQDQIKAWKDGTRPPGPLGLMQSIAQKLSSDDVSAVAAHFATLRAPAVAASGAKSSDATPTAAKAAPAPVPGGSASRTAGASVFAPPNEHAIPDTPMGKVIRRGEQIFVNTQANAPQFVGNALNCVNCHLDAGRLADSAPMWGAYPLYPAYRNKTRHVDTFAERLRGCFMYSMNGTAPPEGGDVLIALEAYSYWMAHGAPIGEKLPGSGYPKVPTPAQKPDFARGAAVFEAQCALCHGADGQGQRAGGQQVFPPLWGARSYNWGAGMHEVDKAAAFIKANMPLGLGSSLSDQQAWDVAWFMNSHERPQDPRFTGDVAQTRQQFHDSRFSLYGTTVDGRLLGTGGQ